MANLLEILSAQKRLRQQQQEIEQLRDELTKLRAQNDSMRQGMRRCNIAYLLFVDVVVLVSLDSTRDMSCFDDVKRFWRIGLILFKGKFLRSLFSPESLLINNDIILGDQSIHNIYDTLGKLASKTL